MSRNASVQRDFLNSTICRSDAEYYKDERDETDEESDEYDLDFRGDFGDYDEEEDYGNYDAYDGDDYDDHLGYGIEVRPRRAASAGRKSPGRSSPRHRGGEVVRGRGTIKGRKGTQGRGSRGGRGRRVAPSAGASVRMQQLKDRLGDAQEELKTKMSSVKQKGAQVIRELKVVLRGNKVLVTAYIFFRAFTLSLMFLDIMSAPSFIFHLGFCRKMNETSVLKRLSVGSACLSGLMIMLLQRSETRAWSKFEKCYRVLPV